MLEELQVEGTNCPGVPFLHADRTSTPAWLIRLACAAHAAAASLAECRDLCERFGVSRTRATIHHWYQSFAEHYDQDFTADPDRIAVDEKQIQLEISLNSLDGDGLSLGLENLKEEADMLSASDIDSSFDLGSDWDETIDQQIDEELDRLEDDHSGAKSEG